MRTTILKTGLLAIGMSLTCGIGVPCAQAPQDESPAAQRVSPTRPEPLQRDSGLPDGDEIRPLGDSLTLMELLYGEPLKLPDGWPGPSGNPYAQKERERKQLQQMRERAQESVLAIPRLSNDLVNRNGFRWRMTVGYLPMNNWSPYEDRWLDARIIRMPLPRNMRPDKRPLAEQRRDALRKSRR